MFWPQGQCGGTERPGTRSGVINSGSGFADDFSDLRITNHI